MGTDQISVNIYATGSADIEEECGDGRLSEASERGAWTSESRPIVGD